MVEEDLRTLVGLGLPWDELAGSRVLVTGAAGLLGAYLVETILFLNEARPRAESRVIALVRDGRRAEERFRHLAGRQDLELLVQDVRDPLPDLLRPDWVIHAASPASPAAYGRDPVGTTAANTVGTLRALEAAHRGNARGFLFVSAGEVYGRVEASRMPLRESDFGPLDPLDPRSCYAESKRAGESLCAAWWRQHGLPVTIARPFHTYGPGLRPDDGRVFADFVTAAVAGKPLPILSDGTAQRTFCYLADTVAGLFTVLLRGEPGQAYNIGNDECEISILDLARLIVDLAPGRQLSVAFRSRPPGAAYIPSPQERYCPATDKVRSLGWAPRVGLREGFTRTLRSFT